jgi:hypothetical protein
VKQPTSCAVCKYSSKLEDPCLWCCGKGRDSNGWYTFPTIVRGYKVIPKVPKWCPLKGESHAE